MKWTYTEKDLKSLLCPAFKVLSVEFDAKKKQLVLDIELPDIGGKQKQIEEIAKRLSPGPSYQ